MEKTKNRRPREEQIEFWNAVLACLGGATVGYLDSFVA